MRIHVVCLAAALAIASLLLGGCQLLPDKENPRVDLDVEVDQVSIIAVPETGLGVLELLVEATDDRELDEVWIEVDGEPYEDSREAAIGDVRFDDEVVIELEPGSHEIEAVARDAAGNEDRSRTQDIEVAESGTAPALTPEQLAAGEQPAGVLPQGHPDIGGKSAGVVPAGQTPRQYVEAYCAAVDSGDYAAAYAMLPPSMQENYGDAAAYGSQAAGYGIDGWSIDDVVESGDTMRVACTQQTPQMPITYTWTFTLSGDEWTCTERVMGGL